MAVYFLVYSQIFLENNKKTLDKDTVSYLILIIGTEKGL